MDLNLPLENLPLENLPRRRTRLEEAASGCECCVFPLAERHHLLEFAEFGENERTAMLCPTCHWVVHICLDAHLRRSERALALWEHLVALLSLGDARLEYAMALMRQSLSARFECHVARFEEDDGHFEIDDF